jgi:hypothetical protein
MPELRQPFRVNRLPRLVRPHDEDVSIAAELQMSIRFLNGLPEASKKRMDLPPCQVVRDRVPEYLFVRAEVSASKRIVVGSHLICESNF